MKKKGFTLIELLVVIAIIGLLSSIVLASLSAARGKARDAKRLSDMNQILTALEMYRLDNGVYPSPNIDSHDYNCQGWDSSVYSDFIPSLTSGDYIGQILGDPSQGDDCTSEYQYRYYKYPKGSSYCDSEKGDFYVFGIKNMEGSSGVHKSNPGWYCSNESGSRNWNTEFEWVTGGFE